MGGNEGIAAEMQFFRTRVGNTQTQFMDMQGNLFYRLIIRWS